MAAGVPTVPTVPVPTDDDEVRDPAPQSDFVIGRGIKTRVLEKINYGSFGSIHRGILLETNEEVAVKLEALKRNKHVQVLLGEGNILRHLEGGPGIPIVHWFGMYEPHYNGLVMEYLGPNLQELFAYCHRKFSIKTILLLFDQVVDIFRYVHGKGYVYRDVKPDNFVIGRGSKADELFIIDFGLAKKLPTGMMLGSRFPSCRPPSPGCSNIGTPRYSSIRAHDTSDLGPSDDLEAFAYVCVYLFRGSLPWQGLRFEDPLEKRARIKQLKVEMTTCQGMPDEFSAYLQYVRSGAPANMPDHVHIKHMFQKLAAKSGIEYDFRFDWVTQKEETGEDCESRGHTDHGHGSTSPC
ncbi:hypothetical protein NP493_1667g00046 [Ridgeia piscesae]|uniref:non-specific serine/threonine protein kinase n=1 Tax=Ridgeia piscesae TaxID=27915 RepID=A0AAD9JVC5_RIDPI|nr:hypothetical protein NP493_1667g00046 [Ridgeia piscesae]